jgi:tetratricopeptide (TPR) repeat protein
LGGQIFTDFSALAWIADEEIKPSRSALGYRCRPYNNRGAAYEQNGDLARAIAGYDDALKLDPANADARRNRERVLAAGASSPARWIVVKNWVRNLY